MARFDLTDDTADGQQDAAEFEAAPGQPMEKEKHRAGGHRNRLSSEEKKATVLRSRTAHGAAVEAEWSHADKLSDLGFVEQAQFGQACQHEACCVQTDPFERYEHFGFFAEHRGPL